ncbi:tetratricopeptide (TPR) repeat protein [Bacillus sp. SLBN-46]|uniref:tetratricopeptide repeat protein n=1 Tax=Bacillus sp. SLBN-46 TaxID=3042283 RepID=UPI0028557AAB|nr:tetratricopeptide repeat protein [Bacillus sp. SLBN-46]MDR6121604.1 tetratricopeptide (TPR) repeat protein [Bacillus sp. SLBN-46]
MKAQQKPNAQEQETTRETKKNKKKKNDRFKWWQALLILMLTLGVSITAAYMISDKYLWSDVDQNQLKDRLDHAKVAVEQKPNDSQARVELGYAYFLNDNNDEAIKQLKVALDLDKKDYNAYLNLGIVYNDEQRYDDALRNAIKATDLSPRDYKGHLLKGIAYRNLKMYKEASESLSQADKLMPGNTDIIFESGRVAEAQGKKDAAEEIYKEALSYDPLYKPALEALDRLSSKN